MISETEWATILEHKARLQSFPDKSEDGSLTSEYYKILQTIAGNPHKRPVVFAHIAQTLDGRIACVNGDSKWIGNEENLHHAHRMRAICDAVMVGQRTVVSDNPQLTVRHVAGDNPIKLLLEGHSTRGVQYKKICKFFNGTEELEIPWRKLEHLLQDLDALGVKSIYLEGGGKTLSYFLRKQLVDRLQVHIAPMVLGSGHPSVTLPERQQIDQALKMTDASVYNVRGQVMISGPINY